MRLAQVRSAQFGDQRGTLKQLVRWVNPAEPQAAQERQALIERVALGKEELEIVGAFSESDSSGEGWVNYSDSPDLRLEVNKPLSRLQKKQLQKIAEVIEVIIDN